MKTNWVSASGLAAVLGVAGLVLALIKDPKSWNLKLSALPSWLELNQRENNNRPKKLFLLPGLQNLGNNCFLNVILQALGSCSNFQSFLQKVIEEWESFAGEEWNESLQLTVALAALLEELSVISRERIVLSPRKVMLAMAHYTQNFNLTSQQDAEEAFLHLLSSLRDEFSDSYLPKHHSLSDAFASLNCRILTPKRIEIQSEQERWQQHFLGPFDGILSSILTCQSCSTEISLNFQFFHSLPLLPVLEGGATIRVGCRLEDCLRQFTVSEQVENYSCSHCWHIAAIKYLSLRGATETEIKRLKSCNEQDSCTCHLLVHLENLPWSNNFSRTLKQLSIARSPKGHISFPLTLNLLPFMMKEMQCQKPSSHLNHFDVQYDTRMLNSIYERNASKLLSANAFRSPAHTEAFLGQSKIPQTTDIFSSQANEKVSAACELVPSIPQVYRLVSVVEHFGRACGGHYTVYRSLQSESHEEHPDENCKPSLMHWFCISDSNVYRVSEEDVLAAEASLLFYERIVES
ncbi:ubiquitin carboxyl-terminal hydrolase 27 isoform X2 [Populus nigra]|uniref:ubiquitin carboxyl-terminal hydrolase 27 isoform X2 n=1 Tax=Populus nigra TaxID=3691 RepID=UPI002B27260D|nr:ubiquitin carboxyl-terminal hydrolase 27 isoform X2 [Populus nigra]